MHRWIANRWIVNCELAKPGKTNIASMFHFLETDIREQKKHELRTQTSVDNTVNYLHYEIKFENCVRDKNNFYSAKDCFSFLNY